MMRLAARLFLAASLAAACATFAVIAGRMLAPLPELAAEPAQSAQEDPGARGGVPVSPPSLASFQAVLDRPLFRPDRRPPEPPAVFVQPPTPAIVIVEEVEVEEPFDGALRGVVTTSEGGVALLEVWSTGEILRLSIGDEHRGWRLVRLNGSSAVFEKGEETIELTLGFAADAARD